MDKTSHIATALGTILAFAPAACSGEPENGSPNEMLGGSSSEMQGGSGGEGAGAGGTTSGGETGGSGGGAMGGSAGTSGFTQRGACGQRGESVVTPTTFADGFEEYYILGDRGFEPEVCIVRFTVKRAGDAPPGCPDCLWAHLVRFEAPTVLLDMGGVCANSELGMNDARMNEIVSSNVAYGFVSEFSGHNSVLMKFDEELQSWEPNGNASWNPMTNAFSFDNRMGQCLY